MNYPISIDDDFVRLIGQVAQYEQVAVLVDENTAKHCLPILKQYISVKLLIIEIPSGENNKNLATCQFIWKKLLDFELRRSALLLNLGGGVIGDMGGFCAATYKRGIDFVQIPTTLLAQVDASVGGKLGVDFESYKNMVGLFKNPKSVVIHTPFLNTLERRQLLSGYAEIIKHALIADADLWKRMQGKKNRDIIGGLFVQEALEIKQKIVARDPYEKGERKALNFGHSFGHAIESYFLTKKDNLLHGESVAIGMVLEAHISFQKKLLSSQELTEISSYLLRLFPTPDLPHLEDLLPFMKKDKKNDSTALNFSLLNGVGAFAINQYPDKNMLQSALDYYHQLK